MDKNPTQSKTLLAAAKQGALKAYAPYSRFRVGCAVETDQGIFIGANIENASSNLGICAERVAIAHARMHDALEIRALAVYCLDAIPDANGRFPITETMPCGACRQWLAELAPQAVVYSNGLEQGLTVSELLPQAFKLRVEKHK
jgi:cytidine deaminase